MRWLTIVALLCVAAVRVGAQADSAPPLAPPEDTAVTRALSLARSGDMDAARALLDSLLRSGTPSDPDYDAALYLRASLASSESDSVRFLNRVLIEAPLSRYVDDARLALAQLAERRGDRRGAIEQLTRFMLAGSPHTDRAQAAISLVRLLFDDGQLPRACSALRMARDAVPADNVEQRNRLEYFGSRCLNVAADTGAATPREYYSFQVAAYDSRGPADRMAKSLTARGIDARVDGTVKPFRVRVGKYPTRPDAVKAAAALKQQGITGFITARLTAP